MARPCGTRWGAAARHRGSVRRFEAVAVLDDGRARRVAGGAQPPRERRLGSDAAEYELRSRIVELEPLAQRVTLEMHAEQ
jgi:hypothetical protein